MFITLLSSVTDFFSFDCSQILTVYQMSFTSVKSVCTTEVQGLLESLKTKLFIAMSQCGRCCVIGRLIKLLRSDSGRRSL